MKMKTKLLLAALLAIVSSVFMAGCSNDESPYKQNDKNNYSVSIKFDANGGIFTTGTSVIVDSYNIDKLSANAAGNVEIPLIAPDDEARDINAFTPIKSGYFLAGWYKNCTESTDADGNKSYTYSEPWDFTKDVLEVDKDGKYKASKPVMTLYAAWVPLFTVEYFNVESGESIGVYEFNPLSSTTITIPEWNTETGAIDMFEFPTVEGYTFENAYYDEKGSELIKEDSITHPGKVDIETATASNSTMKIYVELMEGEWYHIYNEEQFVDNASLTGCYEIHDDLDFKGEIWPTVFTYGNFTGTINGNGHTFKNIECVQSNNNKVYAGLFGQIAETADINEVTFKNVTFTISAGARITGTSMGLFAGDIASGTTFKDVKILESKLLIDSDSYFGVDDYTIGLLCGTGDASIIPDAEITCQSTGKNAGNLKLYVDGNEVTLEFLTD